MTNNVFELTEDDFEAIVRTAATEVGNGRLIRSHPEIIAQMAEAVADTIINRTLHPNFPDTVSAVVNEDWQFSAINVPSELVGHTVYGSWQNVPDQAVHPFLREHLSVYLESRARGAPSRLELIGQPGAIHFANPHHSSQRNIDRWIQPMIDAGAPSIGVGRFVHYHGTEPRTRRLGYSPQVRIEGIAFEPSPDPADDFNRQELEHFAPPTPATPDQLSASEEQGRFGAPNPVPHPDGPSALSGENLDLDVSPTRRVEEVFERMDQDLGPPVMDPRFEPILNRLTPEQMEGLLTELDEVRAQHRRQSDYDATMLQERMARSLQGMRESGRPDDDLDDVGILNTLGEERFADYARQRDGARRYHHAVAGMESLPDQEIEARMVALRSAKAEPGDEGAALQSDVARHVQALRAERQTDPAMAVRRIPEMKQAESELNPDDRESVSAFVGEGLRWQAVQGLAPDAQRAVPRELAQTLADGILAQQADARRDGVRPAVAMRASIDGIRNVFGDAHARSVMNSAFAEMRGADHLASMARHMFERDEMGGMMPSAVPQMMPLVTHGRGAGGPVLKPMGRAV